MSFLSHMIPISSLYLTLLPNLYMFLPHDHFLANSLKTKTNKTKQQQKPFLGLWANIRDYGGPCGCEYGHSASLVPASSLNQAPQPSC